jgi:hypothetical protein
MKWPCRTIAAASIVVGLVSPSFAGQVRLDIRDGLVTLDAKDATLREIFAEWARVGKTKVVNAESIPGGPMTVQFSDVPERQALETLLRSAAGFVAAPRAIPVASASMYDRIMLMPGVRPAVVPTSASVSAPAPGQAQSAWARDRIVQPPAVVVDDEDETPQNAQAPAPGAPPGASPGSASQPGMPTAPLPYNGAGMAAPNGAQNPPATQGTPYTNPYGTPYGNPYSPNPNAQPPATVPPGGATSPQSAPRPGVPTPPATPPSPIKG